MTGIVREPWFLACERAEIRKSGDLGAPLDPRADVFGGGPGLLDELAWRRVASDAPECVVSESIEVDCS